MSRRQFVRDLAFVPPGDVIHAFQILTENNYPDSPEVQRLINYFENYYIGRSNRKLGRANQTFAIDMWNTYTRFLDEFPRTNNAVEAFHRSIQCILGIQHPTLWKLIDGLIKLQKLKDAEITQILGGQNLPVQRKQRNYDVQYVIHYRLSFLQIQIIEK